MPKIIFLFQFSTIQSKIQPFNINNLQVKQNTIQSNTSHANINHIIEEQFQKPRKANIHIIMITEKPSSKQHNSQKNVKVKKQTCNSDWRVVIFGLDHSAGLGNQTVLNFLAERTSHLHSSDCNFQIMGWL